jgi:hypothetical protein
MPERSEHTTSHTDRGVLILAVFATAWALLASWAVATSVLPKVIAAVVSVLIFAAVLTVARGSADRLKHARTVRPAVGAHAYEWINVGQAVAIALAVAILASAGAAVLLPAVICLIVGGHFLPLAWLFRQPQYWWTGALLVAAAVAGLVLLGVGVLPRLSIVVVGFGAALVLWATAADLARRG